jgi:hypothetical protein
VKSAVRFIDIEKVKSSWYGDIVNQWQPDRGYVDFLLKRIKEKQYIAPVVVVQEGEIFFIVNGHHRYYAHLEAGEKKLKCIVIEGTFEDSEPLRKAEVLLKEFDRETGYRYQFSGYLDRWAAAAEEHHFINKYRPTYKFRLYKFLKKLFDKKRLPGVHGGQNKRFLEKSPPGRQKKEN